MSKKNGRNIADRVKAALAPRLRQAQPPRVTQFAMTVIYDARTAQSGVSIVPLQNGVLDIADLYQAVEAARRHVMQMEQQLMLQQAAAQPVQPGAAAQLAEAVVLPAAPPSKDAQLPGIR